MSVAGRSSLASTEGRHRRPAKPLSIGLGGRLLGFTFIFVLIVEALVFIPSAANFRANWIENRLSQARLAVLALDAAPMREVSDDLADALLMRAEVLAVSEVNDGMRQQLLSQDWLPEKGVVETSTDKLRSIEAVGRTLGAMLGSSERFMLIVSPSRNENHMEILVPIASLKADLYGYMWRVLGLSLIIALAVGALVFFTLFFLVVRPIMRITSSVEQFRDNPRDWSRRLPKTARADEIGRAQNALSDMETAVQEAFSQRDRLARLGEAMAKINHDLRNSLAAAQLVSEGLSVSDDPRVQRAAPRLERALERAIGLAQATLAYGRGEPERANPQNVLLFAIAQEALAEGIAGHEDVSATVLIPEDIRARADAAHLHRILVNLSRNAAQAMSTAASAERELRVDVREINATAVILTLADTGPGIPPRFIDNLFQPFSATASKDGSGLGLAIARELAEGMGGSLELVSTGAEGTVFQIVLPPAANDE